MEDDERAQWEASLAEHERLHPAAVITTVDGTVIEPGFEPQAIDSAPVPETEEDVSKIPEQSHGEPANDPLLDLLSDE